MDNLQPHTKLDGAWRLRAVIQKDGTINAESDQIAAAQLILIRDEVRAIKAKGYIQESILRELRGLRRDLKARRKRR